MCPYILVIPSLMVSFEEFGIFLEKESPNQSLHTAVTSGKINTAEICGPFGLFRMLHNKM